MLASTRWILAILAGVIVSFPAAAIARSFDRPHGSANTDLVAWLAFWFVCSTAMSLTLQVLTEARERLSLLPIHILASLGLAPLLAVVQAFIEFSQFVRSWTPH